MITFFTTCKPQKSGDLGLAQTNALGSWRALWEPPFETLVMQLVTDEIAFPWDDDMRYVTVRSVHNRPRVDEMFRLGNAFAKTEIKCYVNSDIILTPDFTVAVNNVSAAFDTFLMLGQRWDVDLPFALDFDNPLWKDYVKKHTRNKGKLHATSGMDYFCYRGKVWPEIPPYAVGCYAWDTWLIWRAVENKIPVIDATKVVMAIHQNHPIHNKRGTEAAQYNLDLFHKDGGQLRGTQHATWELRERGEVVKR